MKRTKLLIAVFALALPFLLSLACGTTAPPAVAEVVTAKSLDADYKPVDPTASYQPSEVIYTSVHVTDLIVGSTVTIKYKLNGETYEESTLTADQAGSGYYGFSLTPGELGHTPGDYSAEVYLDNVLVKTIAFTVEGDATPTIADVVIAESLDSNYAPVNPTSTYKSTDVVSISVKVMNLKVGSEIKIIYTYEGQTQEQTSTVKNSGSGYFGFTFSPPESGHATGIYAVEVFLDGAPYANNPLSFTIVQ